MSDGDRDFEQLYAEYQPRIRRYMARLVGGPDAEDLIEEARALGWTEKAIHTAIELADRTKEMGTKLSN